MNETQLISIMAAILTTPGSKASSREVVMHARDIVRAAREAEREFGSVLTDINPHPATADLADGSSGRKPRR